MCGYQPAARARLSGGHAPGIPTPFGLSPLERIIQINAWLTAYRVRIC
jgi:hypothetical protein